MQVPARRQDLGDHSGELRWWDAQACAPAILPHGKYAHWGVVVASTAPISIYAGWSRQCS